MDSRHSSVPRIASIALVVIAFSGCAGWHSVKGPPAEYIAREKPDVVRLSLEDSSLVLSRPTVEGDRVAGLSKGTHPRRWTGVPAAEIRGLEIHSTRGSRGTKIIAASAVAIFVTMAALAAVPGHMNVP